MDTISKMRVLFVAVAIGSVFLLGYRTYGTNPASVNFLSPQKGTGIPIIAEDSTSAPGFPDATSAPANDTMNTSTLVGQRTVPAGYHEYRSEKYHFSILYPEGLTAAEFDEGSGAWTITFQNPDKGEGFQIFIVPYNQSTVSTQRFKQDEPSGVRDHLEQVTIDGAAGAAFYGRDAMLGDTREVWFIHGGYLYEVTTLKPLEAKLVPVLRTWKFI